MDQSSKRLGLVAFFLSLMLVPGLLSAQEVGLGKVSRDEAESSLSATGLKFSDIGIINGLPTLVAPGEGSSFQIQGPPERLMAITVRWNGRFAMLDENRSKIMELLKPYVPQVSTVFFGQLQRAQQLEVVEDGIEIKGRYRKLGNQISLEIQARVL